MDTLCYRRDLPFTSHRAGGLTHGEHPNLSRDSISDYETGRSPAVLGL